jgi:hypothetical protein
MDVENNGMQGTRWIIQVWASVRIKILRPVCIGCIIIRWIETPFYPSFYRLRGLQGRIGSVIIVPNHDSISTRLFTRFYL